MHQQIHLGLPVYYLLRAKLKLLTCNLRSLGSTVVAPRQCNSFCKNTSSCSRNFGFGVFVELAATASLTTTSCLLGLRCKDGPFEPRTDACAGHVSTIPAFVSWYGCSSTHTRQRLYDRMNYCTTCGWSFWLITSSPTAVTFSTETLVLARHFGDKTK